MQTVPDDGLHGIRCGGGVIQLLAIEWNVGTCRCDDKGKLEASEIETKKVPMRRTGTELSVVVLKRL